MVGEAVSANRQYTANKSVGHCRQYLVVFLLCPIRQTLIFVTRRKTLVVFYTYTLMWKKRYYFTATSERRRAGAEAVPNRKPRSEWHGWETSFKQALLLRAEGAIRAFFDGYCQGDTASGVRSEIIPLLPQYNNSKHLFYKNTTKSLCFFTSKKSQKIFFETLTNYPLRW